MSQRAEKYARRMERRVDRLEERAYRIAAELTKHENSLDEIRDAMARSNAACVNEVPMRTHREIHLQRRKIERSMNRRLVLMLIAVILVCAALYLAIEATSGDRAETGPAAALIETVPKESAEPVLAVEIETPRYIYDPAIPLSPPLQKVLHQVCAEADVPVPLALGLIEVESGFEPYADNGQCYGLCQINRNYFPDKLPPADNIRAGIDYLGRLLAQYGNAKTALTVYNAGYDTGNRGYADAVLEAMERWECTVGAWAGE